MKKTKNLLLTLLIFVACSAPQSYGASLKGERIFCRTEWLADSDLKHKLEFVFVPKGCSEGEEKKDCYIVRSQGAQSGDWDLGEGVMIAGNEKSDYCLGAEGNTQEKRITLFSGSSAQGKASLVCVDSLPIAVELVASDGKVERCALPVTFPLSE